VIFSKPKYHDSEPESLIELREIVDRVGDRLDEPIPFPPRLPHSGASFRQHKMACGTSLEFPLYEEEATTCSLFFHSAGTDFPHHSHEQREWLIVIKGSLFIASKVSGEWEPP